MKLLEGLDLSYSAEEELTRINEAVKRLGSQRAAADELGLSRSALQRRLYAANDDFLERKAGELGFDASQVSSFWLKDGSGSFNIKRNTQVGYNDLRQGFLDFAANHAPVVKRRSYQKADHLLVVDPADIHFNKLALKEEVGSDYNLDIAESRLLGGVESLLAKSELFGIDKIVFVLGNDFLNSDNPLGTTTGGTPQDNATLWWDAYNKAKAAFVSAIEMCSEYAPVHLVHNASNHDFASGWMLSDSISSWFRNDANVNISNASMSIAHRKYMQYGNNILGFTHGDGAKDSDLSSLMQVEARQAWAESIFATWYLHHYHTKTRKSFGRSPIQIEKDHIGVTVMRSGSIDPTKNVMTEVVRSASGPDRWHHTKGFVSKQAIECFMHHVDRGPGIRFTEWF